MSRPTPAIVGRDHELHDVSAFLDRVEDGPGALVLEGSAGIGKTTIWLAGVEEATSRGYRVVQSRGAESEARLSYAALGDLLGDAPDALYGGMPVPLRQALDAALLRSEALGDSVDPRAVSLAAAHAFRRLAADVPIIVAIDDLQWIDGPSARVLSFVLRRVADERIGVLVSIRLGSGSSGDPVDLDRALTQTTHVGVGPLPLEPLGRILRDRTRQRLPHPDVARLHRITGGNPLFAIEMARAASGDELRSDPDGVWAVPEDLQQLLSARLAALPPTAHEPLLAIAATSQPTWELVLQIAGSSERTLEALSRAEGAGVIERASGRVRFSHPLLASTVYVNSPPAERRALHVRLAALASDPEERARHLALGAAGPDPEVAIALDQAARGARLRGAPDAAADLADLACRMTGPDDIGELRGRRLDAAEYRFDAGDATRAIGLLRETIATTAPGPERAKILYRLASMSWMNLINGVRAPCEQARSEAGNDAELQAGIHLDLAWVAFYLADLDEARADARAAVDWVGNDTGPRTRADAFATLSFIEFVRGHADPAALTEAVDLQAIAMSAGSWTEGSVYTPPGAVLGLELMWTGRLDDARDVLERELAQYELRGMYIVRQEVLCYLAELECRAGRWRRAIRFADESMDIVQESGQAATQSHVALFNQSWPRALLGRTDEAREQAMTGVRLAEANDDRFNAAWNHAVLGFIDLSLADLEGARRNLESAVAWLDRLHSAEAAIIPCVPDLVEALVGLGRIDDAERHLGRLEEQAQALDRAWARATALRCRALIAAAGGDLDAAQRSAEGSVELLERGPQPFETARSVLVLGQIHRRAKRKRLARESLERARDAFAELGARLWVERAESELARIGGRPSTPFELTETERTIASLVARGQTNQEVADALFVSASTVQANLKRVYQKLGVRSRTELAAKVDLSPES